MPDHEGMVAVQPSTEDAAHDANGSNPFDFIPGGIKAFFDLGLQIGKKFDAHTDALQRLLKRLERNTPVDYTCIASGTVPAAGNLVLNLGSPDIGTYWEVESCAVGGTDQNVTAAGAAGLYTSGLVPTTGSTVTPGMTSMRDQAKTFPNVAFYGGRELLVKPEEYLYLVVFGGTVGQVYAANARVTVYNIAAGGGGPVEITA